MDRVRLFRFAIGICVPSLLIFCAQAGADDGSFAPIGKAIDKSVTSLGYPQSTAADLQRFVRTWNLEGWSQKLVQARAAKSPTQSAEVARAEEESVRWLYQTLGQKISCSPVNSKYFDLAAVVRDKKAQCVGFTELFWTLGTAIGLSVHPINVLAPLSSPRVAHVACLVSLSDGKSMIVDGIVPSISSPFDFKTTFAEDGNYWERTKETGPEICRRLQILDANGLAACAYIDLGRSNIDINQRYKAIASYDKAIELCPKLAEAYNTRGADYFQMNRYPQALADFNKAIELDPKNALAFQNRATLFTRTRQSKEAVADFTKSIECDPKFSEPYFGRAFEYSIDGRYPQSIRDLTACIELDPKNYRAYHARAAAYKAMHKFTEAIDDLNRAIELNPNSLDSFSLLGITYGEMEQYPKAIASFNKAIELDPKYAIAYMNRAVAYVHLGKSDEARADFQKGVELDPASKPRIQALAEKLKLEL